jgi:hypothetical protein
MVKQMCTICGKQFVRLNRHMITVHNYVNGITKEPSNIREFLQMCTLLPIHMDLWSKLLTQHESEVKSFIHDGVELPNNLMYVLRICYAKYRACETKLVIKETPKVKAVDEYQDTNSKSTEDHNKQSIDDDEDYQLFVNTYYGKMLKDVAYKYV